MISFKQWLRETLAQERIHRNPSIGQLKNLTKNSHWQAMRFTVHDDGTVMAGDAGVYSHHQVGVGAFTPQSPSAVRGGLFHKDGKYSYLIHGDYSNHPPTQEFVKRLEKHGITRD